MKKQNNPQRLPTVCGGSPKCECLVFLALGLSGLFVIGSAVFNSARFADARDHIVDGLTSPYAIVQSPIPSFEGTNMAAQLRPATNSAS